MHSSPNTVQIKNSAVNPDDLNAILDLSLPKQGCVEFQRDQAGKEHSWHQHDTDETLIIIEGEILFYWDEGDAVCKPGDVIQLPKGVRHGSKAAFGDVKYLITFETVELNS